VRVLTARQAKMQHCPETLMNVKSLLTAKDTYQDEYVYGFPMLMN
jgi:hypothetical protein